MIMQVDCLKKRISSVQYFGAQSFMVSADMVRATEIQFEV